MRPLLVGLLLAGCNTTCDEASCHGWCEQAAMAAQPAELPERQLTLDEVEVLGERLIDVRNGVFVVGEDGFGICRGTTGCESYLGRGIAEPLPPGEYIVTARLHIPAVGEWPMMFVHHCEDDGPQGRPGRFESFREERRFDLRASADGKPVDITPLARVQTTPGNGRHCTYALQPIGWAIGQELAGQYPVHTR